MTSLVAELSAARNDTQAMAERLFSRDERIEELKAELEKAREESAAQKQHIARLKVQLSRPVRQLAKKALGRRHG